MRDDAVLGRALPLDRGLGPNFHFIQLQGTFQTFTKNGKNITARTVQVDTEWNALLNYHYKTWFN